MIGRRTGIERKPITRKGTRALSSLGRSEFSRLKERADDAFRKFIVWRDRCCSGCRVEINLECAHFFTRSRISTRWDRRCATTLCHGCHGHYTTHTYEWTEGLIAMLGQAGYDKLRMLSQSVPPDRMGLARAAVRDGHAEIDDVGKSG